MKLRFFPLLRHEDPASIVMRLAVRDIGKKPKSRAISPKFWNDPRRVLTHIRRPPFHLAKILGMEPKRWQGNSGCARMI